LGQASTTIKVSGNAVGDPARVLSHERPRALRGSFDRSLDGWRRTGDAFGSRPMRTLTVPIDRELDLSGRVGGDYGQVRESVGARGKGWVTSFRTRRVRGETPEQAGDLATGTLISPPFRVTRRYLHYLLGGRSDRSRGRSAEAVEIWRASRKGVFRRLPKYTRSPQRVEGMQQVLLDLRVLRGAVVGIVVRDGSPDGHINVDDFGTSPARGHTRRAPRLGGFADTHTHIMAHQGFGALEQVPSDPTGILSGFLRWANTRTYMGVPGGRWSGYASNPFQYRLDTKRDENHHFGGPMGAFLINVIEGRRKAEGGAPVLGSFISTEFHDATTGPAHEQMHITELHRAWEGGERLITSLAVTNNALEWMMGKPRNRNGGGQLLDFSSAPAEENPEHRSVNVIDLASPAQQLKAHVVAMRQLAELNSDWMQIVYSPQQAEQAIRDGKLAVVLGTEMDVNGSLGLADSPESEVDALWRMGYRQITPLHAIDNGLGGAAVFQEAYNTQDEFNHRPSDLAFDYQNVTTRHLNGDVDAQGLEVDRGVPPSTTSTFQGDPHASYTGRRNFGHFFHVEPWGCRPAPGYAPQPRGECIDWRFDFQQGLLSVGGDFGYAHPEPQSKDVAAYAQDIYSRDREGMRNTEGLTGAGRAYIHELMKQGMLIDVEHMSQRTIDDVLAPGLRGEPIGPVWEKRAGRPGCDVNATTGQIQRDAACWAQAYPVMSSHTSFRAQSLPGDRRSAAEAENHECDPMSTDRICGSTIKGYTAREFERTPREIEYIRRSGGTIAPVVGHDPVETITPRTDDPGHTDWQPIPGRDATITSHPSNNCGGSSRSWVQAYLYGVQKMGGHSVALSTDMTLVGSTGPRFGDRACPSSHAADLMPGRPDDYHRIEEARFPEQYERSSQGNPIDYTQPDTANVHPAGMRELQRPDGEVANLNTEGLRTYGLMPDLIQDAGNDGVTGRDLSPLMYSAQGYIDMWNKAYAVAGCTGSSLDVCQGGRPEPINQLVCLNTCPFDANGLENDSRRYPYHFDHNVSP
jgi:microsomal dipeptidase-like Zn-dependent dipeptidase